VEVNADLSSDMGLIQDSGAVLWRWSDLSSGPVLIGLTLSVISCSLFLGRKGWSSVSRSEATSVDQRTWKFKPNWEAIS